MVAIDSQLGTPAEGKPFGEGPAKALEEGLKIAQELGFKTVNLDNYCGYAEMGEGDEIVGIVRTSGLCGITVRDVSGSHSTHVTFLCFTCRIISNHRVKDRKVMFGDQGIFIDR